MMTINVLRCPRNAGAVANNKRVHASSDRCSSSNSTKNTNTNSRRRKGVVLSSFGKAWKSLFISLFFFFLVLSLRSRERKKRLNSLLSCSSSSSSSPRRRFGAFSRARKRRVRVLLCGIVIVRDLGSISEEFCARARERSSLTRERENKTTAEGEERKFSSSLFSLFLSVSYKSKKRGVEEDPSCGSESVAVKKGGRKEKRREFFFCSDIHSFSLLSYLQKQGITTRTIKGRYTRTL